MALIVELTEGVYLAGRNGDTGRTLSRKSAKQFPSMAAAQRAITEARQYRDFRYAQVVARVRRKR